MNRGAPWQLANAAGLSLELNRDGGVRRIQFREEVVNLFMGNGMEPGPTNVWLRLHRAGGVEAVPLLGPRPRCGRARPAAVAPASRRAASGRGWASRCASCSASEEPTWCWQVRLENRSSRGADRRPDCTSRTSRSRAPAPCA